MEQEPIRLVHRAAVDTDVTAPALATGGDRELVDVGPQVTDPVKYGRRRVGDYCDPSVVEALPGGRIGIELKPSRPQAEMVGLNSPAYPVYTSVHAFEQSDAHQSTQRAPSDAGPLSLTLGDKAPLTLRYLDDPLHWSSHTAKYTNFGVVCSSFDETSKRPGVFHR